MLFEKLNSELKRLIHHRSQGIPEKDLCDLANYAEDHDIILMIRPVEVLSRSLHGERQYPTKSFKIKGKSASWGPAAGFIPVDQRFSKLVGARTGTIKKANEDVQACIEAGDACPSHLKITEQRFQELKEKEIILPQRDEEDGYLVIYCSPPHSKTLELFYAKKTSKTEYQIYTSEKQPLYVLADKQLQRPLIADYDLLAIFFPWKNYSQDNIRLNPYVTHPNRQLRLSPNSKRRSKESAEAIYAREDPEMGNVAPITITHIEGLNKTLNKGKNLQCFHHNDDAGSPASNPLSNYPITAIVPLTEDLESRMIETPEEFVDFINKINSLGYYRVEVNPLWELAVKWAAQRNFFLYQAKIAYANKNVEIMERTLKKIFKFIQLTDSTFIDEIINLFKLMAKGNFDNTIFCEKFFDFTQSALLVNSILVVRLCRSLEFLLDNQALSEKNIDHLIILTNLLRKDVQSFYKLLDKLSTLANKDVKIIDEFLLNKTIFYKAKFIPSSFDSSLNLNTEVYRHRP